MYRSFTTQAERARARRWRENVGAFAMQNSVFGIRFLQHIKFVLRWFIDSLLKALMYTWFSFLILPSHFSLNSVLLLSISIATDAQISSWDYLQLIA